MALRGWSDDVRPVLHRSMVVVLPSYYGEGIPRSLVEALAVGRPVITTDMPGCRETVIEGENGFMVPLRDPDALANAMERFLRDPGMTIEMGRASRDLADRRFDARIIAARMVGLMLRGRGCER